MYNSILQSFKSFHLQTFLFFFNLLMSFSKLELLNLKNETKQKQKPKKTLKESCIGLYERILFTGQML